MALDETLLSMSAQKTSLPTLRLYSWQTPTLSLGYAQNASEIDLAALKDRGWQMVRRPTGGKAILHTDELTYSITAPLDAPLVSGTLLESYQRISHALQKALEALGVKTQADHQYPAATGISKNDPVCFKSPSNFEITWNGKKLIGSAQARKYGGVLQHGSLPLHGDLTRINQVILFPSNDDRELASKNILDRAVTLHESANRMITWEEASVAFCEAFSTYCDIDFVRMDPTADEESQALELVTSKYDTESWTFRL